MNYLLLLLPVLALLLVGIWAYKKYKASEVRAKGAEKELEYSQWKLGRIIKNIAVDFTDALQLNTVAYRYPTFDSDHTNMVLFTPLGCFIAKKTDELYNQLVAAGYYQLSCHTPVDSSNGQHRDIPYDPSTGNAVSAKKIERWQQLAQAAKDAEPAARVAYDKLHPLFLENEEADLYQPSMN